MNFLLNLDLIGQKPQMLLNNKPSYQTYLGFILSIFMLSLTIYSSQDSMSDYVNKKFPKESIDYQRYNDKINFNMSSLPILIQYTYYDVMKGKYEDFNISELSERYHPIIELRSYLTEGESGNLIRLFPCNLTMIQDTIMKLNVTDPFKFSIEKEYWKEYIRKAQSSYCFNQNNIKNEYILYNENKYIVLAITSELDSILTKAIPVISFIPFVSILYPKYILTASNVNIYIKDIDYLLFPVPKHSSINAYEIFFNSFKIVSDYSEFFIENKVERVFYSIDSPFYRGSVEVGESLKEMKIVYSSLLILLNMSKLSRIYQYKYVGIGDILSELGGSFQIYYLLISILYGGVIKFSYQSYLLNSIFSFHVSQSKGQGQRHNTNTKENQNEYSKIKYSTKISHVHTNSSLKMKKTMVKSRIEEYLNKKEKRIITTKQVFMSFINKILNKQSVSQKIITNCLFLLESQFDYSKIIQLFLEDFIQKEIIMDDSLHKFMNFPSINLENYEFSIRLIEKIMKLGKGNENILLDDVEKLIDKDHRKNKYSKLFDLFMEVV